MLSKQTVVSWLDLEISRQKAREREKKATAIPLRAKSDRLTFMLCCCLSPRTLDPKTNCAYAYIKSDSEQGI